jgi:hypothetical protein
MKVLRGRALVLGVVAVASSVFLSACESEVKGGAILSPIAEDCGEDCPFPGDSEGEALLAVAAKFVDNDGEDNDVIRSAGTFRNRTQGVAFTFRANNSDTLPLSMVNAASAVMSKFETSDVQCAAFVGEYRRVSGTDELLSTNGIVVSIIFQVGGGETFVIVLAGGDGPSYGYFGSVKSGKLLAYSEEFLEEGCSIIG